MRKMSRRTNSTGIESSIRTTIQCISAWRSPNWPIQRLRKFPGVGIGSRGISRGRAKNKRIGKEIISPEKSIRKNKKSPRSIRGIRKGQSRQIKIRGKIPSQSVKKISKKRNGSRQQVSQKKKSEKLQKRKPKKMPKPSPAHKPKVKTPHQILIQSQKANQEVRVNPIVSQNLKVSKVSNIKRKLSRKSKLRKRRIRKKQKRINLRLSKSLLKRKPLAQPNKNLNKLKNQINNHKPPKNNLLKNLLPNLQSQNHKLKNSKKLHQAKIQSLNRNKFLKNSHSLQRNQRLRKSLSKSNLLPRFLPNLKK